MASTIQALPSGAENRNGSSSDGTAALEAQADDRGWFDGSPAPVSDRRGTNVPRLALPYHLTVSDAVALIVTWVPLALIDSGAGRARQLVCAAAAVVSTMVAIRRAGLYRSQVRALPDREVARVLVCATLGGAVFTLCGWLAGSATWAAALTGAAISGALILVFRWRFARWLKARHSIGQYLRTTLLVGTNDDAVALWETLTAEPELGYRIVGVAGEKRGDAPWNGLPQCVEISDFPDLAGQTGADGVIVVPGALTANTTSVVVRQALAAGLHVQIWPGVMGLSSRRVRFAPVSGIPVLWVEPPCASIWQKMAKRTIDVVVTIAISPLVVPVLIAAAICIKLEDRGPVIYRNSVIGRYGKPITVLKLRTMVPNAAQMLADVEAMNERTGGPLFKASRDPRVTKIGHMLRASSIDELPQLWNVLTGKMSLVGPRPALPHEDARFDPELRRRYEVRPGITGLWQSEARDNPAFSAYHRLDLLYVENWSLGLDLAILANTAHAVGVRALKAILPIGVRHQTESGPSELRVLPLTIPELASVEAVSPE